MQPIEALTRLIQMSDDLLGIHPSQRPENEVHEEPALNAELDANKLAVSICQAMLNTAVPVARYRVFVRYDKAYPLELSGSEFTICCVKMEEVKAALRPLMQMNAHVAINVFEQRSTGADMLCGYQGATKSFGRVSKFQKFLDNLHHYDLKPTVQ